jgi:HNH endonuclease
VSLTDTVKYQIRQRANFSCEYCGVSEENIGGELSIDHFRPQSKQGSDEIDNLVCCCIRCNMYKGNFWVKRSDKPILWNPRLEALDNHCWQAENGRLFALTETGELTLRVLNLNRPQLVIYRRQQFLQSEERRLLREHEAAVETLLTLNEEQRNIIRTQQTLLKEQQRLIKILLR